MNRPNESCISKQEQPSIYYRWKPDERIFFELANSVHQDDSSKFYAKRNRHCCKVNEHKSSEILTTSQIISAGVWNLSGHPLTLFRPNGALNKKSGGAKEVILNNMVEVDGKAVTLTENKKGFIELRTDSPCSPVLQPTLDFSTVTQKISMLKRCKNYSVVSLWRQLQGGDNESKKSPACAQISYDLKTIYGWMSDIILREVCYLVKVADSESTKFGALKPRKDVNKAGSCISEDSSFLANELINETFNSVPYLFQSINLSSFVIQKMKTIKIAYMASDILSFGLGIETGDSILKSSNLDVLTAYPLPSKDGALFDKNKTENSEQHESKAKCPDESVIGNEFKIEGYSLRCEKPCYTLAKQEHAFAGALAGVFVSLCLHPVDTIKTVVQSYHAEKRTLSYIGNSIVSNRGLSGLYRGISANIATSAPISAVYTSTYESVKGGLLPLFPKEYHSFAHCMAGGSASVATSFIFTPSERIKQQMQVSGRYHNCWNALVGIVATGGLRGLYTGWGAVLCRNVPHSIIKFYTYESFKGLMNSNAQPSTLQTLVSGGVAGSTAAFFTTPFDVVKTRLQTQIPGSLSPYNNVIHALHQIGKKEGLKGLYRGLTPRLVMYMSQGAIFFASYETFKRYFFSQDVSTC